MGQALCEGESILLTTVDASRGFQDRTLTADNRTIEVKGGNNLASPNGDGYDMKNVSAPYSSVGLVVGGLGYASWGLSPVSKI